jgi:hypothetical protein
MPRKQTYCARGPDHPPPCATPEAMERQRTRNAGRERIRPPEAVKRWRAKFRLSRYGLTDETFSRLLEIQQNACAMCFEPFQDGQPVFVDHDHACCPDEKKSCGRCVRGLLCLRCNVALGYIERMGELARSYLDRPPALVGSPPIPHRGR